MSLETINFSNFPLASGQKVLDLGCGEGRHSITAYMAADVHVFGLDFSLIDLNIARERSEQFLDSDASDPGKSCSSKTINFLQGNALVLPFENASFDRVICSEVLEHLQDYSTALSEIQRILKPGGLLAISVPRRGPEALCWLLSRAYHEVEGGHVRIFKAKQLRCAIEIQNFHFYKRHWAHALHSPYWWLKCLFWSNADQSRLLNLYHKFLVWDLMKKPKSTRLLEHCLNPFIGKSVVMYFIRGSE